MASDYTIREARLEDAAAIAETLRELGWFARIGAEPPAETARHVRDSLRRDLADASHSVLIAEDGQSALVGYLAIHWLPNLIKAPDGYISELFLRKAARGRGAGGALLDAARGLARARGCDRLMLINRRERPSYQRGFYTKHGWQERADVAFFTLALSAQE